jgi:hypothetical protein
MRRNCDIFMLQYLLEGMQRSGGANNLRPSVPPLLTNGYRFSVISSDNQLAEGRQSDVYTLKNWA